MSQLTNAIADLNEDEALRIVRQRLEAAEEPMTLVEECRRGMDIVGERYKSNEYFLGELIMSSTIFKEAMALIEPKLNGDTQAPITGRIVLGTVKGDIHNIGKDIVATLLRTNGFEVFDLGVDVEPQAFAEKLVETGAPILGLSALLTPAFESMKRTVKAVEEKGIRDKVKVIIGGAIVTRKVKDYVGADAFTRDGVDGVDMCKEFMEGMKI
jgi:methylmalonyl-CoA mutase cobalamin-binding domain/chain